MADAELTRDQKLGEIIRQAIIHADMDDVAAAIDEASGRRTSVFGITAQRGESDPDVIYVTFEGELLDAKKGAEDGLYLECEVRVKRRAQ